MQQLAFELAAPEPPTFANFATGSNAEAVTALRQAAVGGADAGSAASASSIVVWGAPGAGCTHLLRAAVAHAAAQSRPVLYCASPAASPAEPPDPGALIAVDDIGTADAVAQGHLFTLFNRLADTGGTLIAAASAPPARLALRDDLRSRLGSGLVYEVVPLADPDKPAALAAYARGRGVSVPDEVIAYLLAHGRRDMGSLMATVAALDRASLAARRPITVPLLREFMQRTLPIAPPLP